MCYNKKRLIVIMYEDVGMDGMPKYFVYTYPFTLFEQISKFYPMYATKTVTIP